MTPDENPWEEVPRLAWELLARAATVVLEACLLITWALVIWGISEALSRIEPHMPSWATLMFKYVEIGFALFLLLQMFLLRVKVFETAVVRTGLVFHTMGQVIAELSKRPE